VTKKDNAGALPDLDGKEDPRQRPEEVLNFMSKSIDFIKELMEDNERLRYRAVQLQEENRELFEGMTLGRRTDLLRQQIKQLENEKDRLQGEYHRVEDANKAFAARYVEIEDENNNLANLYVCSFQLHSTLVFDEVLQIIMEIIINLIGAEEFAIFLLDEKNQCLQAVAIEGKRAEGKERLQIGEGVIGKTVASGQNYYDPSLNTEGAARKRALDDPLVCIPLLIKDRAIGVIALYKLLPQKRQFANVDYELFTLLAGHAATAIFSAKLYSEAQRKLSTIKGFMELLTSPE
jgi:nitrate/nitrite-specific signal transduction histidine kinase